MQTILTVIGLLITAGITIATTVWVVSRSLAELRSEMVRRDDDSIRMFGESLSAIREKINIVELYAANNYVRRDGFYKVQEQFTVDIRALGEKMDRGFERFEEKIDSKIDDIEGRIDRKIDDMRDLIKNGQ